MAKKYYYSVRTGKHPEGKNYSLDIFNRLLKDIYTEFSKDGFFDEYFGFSCVDSQYYYGKLGDNISAKVFRALKKDGLYPFEEKFLDYTEEDTFDVIEFLFDHVSKPTKGEYHANYDCGMHWDEFDKKEGEIIFVKAINDILIDYSQGFQLSEDGEILIIGENGLNEIFDAKVKTDDPENVDSKIQAAIKRFRHHRSSVEERKNAVRELFDVLEYLKSKSKNILNKKDDSDLFNIANNFGIRHHNASQKTDYDEKVWLSWMFYFCLSTVYAYINLIKKDKS